MIDIATLQAALLGYQAQHDQIVAKMDELRRQLGKTRGAGSIPTPLRTKRALSAAARKRIADAQRKRWAEYRAKGGRASAGAKASARKPVSPEVRQKRIAALAKARAAKAQKKTAVATA
jgi:hypothetical protein